MLFILLTAGIIDHIKLNPIINRATKGQHTILAFMDDIKCHSNTKQGMKIITDQLRKAAEEIGLFLNDTKCGVYCKGVIQDEENENDVPFLPEVREGYKYLGLEQLERDTTKNLESIKEKITNKTRTIFSSKLTSHQKIKLFNCTVIPAAIYVLGNMYADEKRATSLKNCRDIDTEIRNILVELHIKGRTTSNARTYLNTDKGGLGLKSVEFETEIHYVRKGIYLQAHIEMEKTYNSYKNLQKAGWRNPLNDSEFVCSKYGYPLLIHNRGEYQKICEETIKQIRTKFEQQNEAEWTKNLHYGKIVSEEAPNISFPAYSSPHMDGWRLSLIHAASEEQLHGLGSIPGRRKMCRRGCNNTETAYHVSSACPTNSYITRHDNVVHWVLKTIINHLDAPEEISRSFQFGKASLNTNFKTQSREISIRAGIKFLTEKQLYHNKPDIWIKFTNPTEIYIFEIAVAHIQNYRLQEKIKKTRYAINSVAKIDNMNVQNIGRDLNLISEMENIHHCPVHFGIFIIGCYGEIIKTEEHNKFRNLLTKNLKMENKEVEHLMNKCCYSVTLSTSQILSKHLKINEIT